jgi:hypothetical protein
MLRNVKIFCWVIISIILLNSNKHFLSEFGFTFAMSLLLIAIIGNIIVITFKNIKEDEKNRIK